MATLVCHPEAFYAITGDRGREVWFPEGAFCTSNFDLRILSGT
jgi:hypothetical protein